MSSKLHHRFYIKFNDKIIDTVTICEKLSENELHTQAMQWNCSPNASTADFAPYPIGFTVEGL